MRLSNAAFYDKVKHPSTRHNILVAKKNVAVHIPLQMGFGFEVTNAVGKAPKFLWREADVLAALDIIGQAQWVSTDVETTGLTEASLPVALGNPEIKQGSSNFVRMRTIQVRVPTVMGRRGPRLNFAFDTDRMGPALTQRVARVILGCRMFIAHNAGFDLYWLRRAEGRMTMPQLVVDSMLQTRCLRPELVLVRCDIISAIRHANEVSSATPQVQAAWKSLIGGSSGGSLADVVLAMFNVVVDKTYQKPNNWTGLLGFAHYDYAIDDVYWADRIMCDLLGVDEEGDLLQAYLSIRARRATVRLIEPQVPELVLLRERGMPLNTGIGRRFVNRKRIELAKVVDDLIALEPTLEPVRPLLANPDAGQTDELKKLLATAFEARGVTLRRTPTGMPQVGEKDLRACRAVQMESSRPLFNAWVAVCRSKKTSAMALDVVGFAERGDDGRVRSLMSHGPVTGRLSASEPNCFTGDTEILTLGGWVRFDLLQQGVPVAQYEKGGITFALPTEYVTRAYDGHLIHNQTRALDLMTTPGHRCLVVDPKSGNDKLLPAMAFPDDQQQVHAGRYGGGAGLPLTSRDIQALVMAQAVGSWSEDDLVLNLEHPHHRARALTLGFSDLSGALRASVPATEVARAYLGADLAYGAWLLEMSRDQLDIFLAEVAQWTVRLPGSGKRKGYSTSCKQSADMLQAAYALSNIRARVMAAPGGWRVTARPGPSNTTTSTRHQTIVEYTGNVYCVSVPSGLILIRRAGLTMVTGQCQQWPRDQLFRAMCMSNLRPGCESMLVVVSALNQKLVAAAFGGEVDVGDTVRVDSAWFAALFAADKDVQEKWDKADKAELETQIDAQFTHKIIASDFGALDVRVGAALCIRSQREMLDVAAGKTVPGPVQPPEAVVSQLKAVAKLLTAADPVAALAEKTADMRKNVVSLETQLQQLSDQLDAGTLARKTYWDRRREIKEKLLSVKMGWRFAECLSLGAKRGEREYSALRDAFVADIDIHTFTGMKLAGRDPMAEFEGLSPGDRKKYESKLKKELGPRRQQGKIANLSLLYGMADLGFQEAAARGYDTHWTLDETHEIRSLWMDSYPEVELWHLWTECLQAGVVYVPEMGKEKPTRCSWYMARTLSGRQIVAMGLNAALSYQDQSSGADILGLIMHDLHDNHRDVFDMSINQVHDEQVFETPVETAAENLVVIETCMVEQANSLTMPYGVPCAVSPAIGPLWIKD